MSAKWPSAVATDADLFTAVNLLQTTLSGTINNSVTTITLTSTTGFPTAGAVTIDNEVIFYTGVSGSNLTGCTRASDGTTAASHNSGVPVGATIVAFHHNGLMAEIEAIETDLHTRFGFGSSAITFGAPISGYQTWSVAGTALPANSGTTPSAGTILRMLGNSNAVFDFGSDATVGAWIQSYDKTGMGTSYPLLLNPRGGGVSVGAVFNDAPFRVEGLGSAAPANSGSTQSIGLITRLSGNTTQTMDIGSDSGTSSIWFQGILSNDLSVNLPIHLNPNGGNVSVGADLTVGTTAAIQATSNQVVLGATRTVTLTAPTPASSSRTVTIPDLSANYSVVGTEAAQTINGVKTFSSNVVASADIYTTALADYSGTSTIVGFSAFTSKVIQYKKVGKTVTVYYYISGTGNNTATTFTLPAVMHANIADLLNPYYAIDNSGTPKVGVWIMFANSATITLYPDAAGSNWTASGTRTISGTIVYETN